MIVIQPTDRAVMEARQAQARPEPARSPEVPQAPRNLGAILDLGNMVFFLFRGRPYGAPPLPWRAGQRLMDLWLQALRHRGDLTDQTAKHYYSVIAQLPALLWHLTSPVGRTRRILRALGLHRNPFRGATEQELVDLAAFFLARRRMSSIGLLPATTTKRQRAHQSVT